MQRNALKSERGQAVVIIVVAMVVLLGFTALAVDGSMVYSDRRHAQSAADSSSLAGGTRLAQDMEANNITNDAMYGVAGNCSNVAHMTTITLHSRQAAQKRAGDNDFTTFNANLTSAQLAERGTGAITSCGKEAVTGLLAGGQEAVLFEQYYVDMQSQITDQTETAFAHFVYGGEMENTVAATTRVYPRQPLAYGYAIVALNDDINNCNQNRGLQFGGRGDLKVLDGGIFSNGCMDVDGNAGSVQLIATEHSDKRVPGAFWFGTANRNTLDKIKFGTADYDNVDDPGGVNFVSGSPLQLADIQSNRIPLSTYDIPMPDCSGHEVDSDWVTGYYDSHSGQHIPAGLYCVTDELRIGAHDVVKADKVTFVLLDGMTINGNADEVDLRMRYPGDPETGAIAGLLFYQPRNVTAAITVNGNSNSTFRGSWICPGASMQFDGTADFKIFGQIVGYNVDFRGNVEVKVEYRQNKVTSRPARLELHK